MSLEYGASQIGKRNYKLYIKTSADECTSLSESAGAITGAVARRLGALAEQPKFTTDKGEEVVLETGAKKNLSQITNFEAVLMQVTEDNYEELKEMINTQIDVFMTDAVTAGSVTFTSGIPALSEVGKQVIMIRGQYAFPALSIVGNDRNTITISSSKETSATLTALDMIFVEGA